MPIDLSKLREDVGRLSAPSRAPESQPLEPAQPSDVAAARRSLQEQRGALNAEAAPPGQEPEADPIDEAMHAGRQHPRGSDQAMQAYLGPLLAAAHAGDPRVVTQGVVDNETRERWQADAHTRQVSNRDQSGAAHR